MGKRDRVGMRTDVVREGENVDATIYGKRADGKIGENRLLTTTFVGRGFKETKKTDEILRKPGKRTRF